MADRCRTERDAACDEKRHDAPRSVYGDAEVLPARPLRKRVTGGQLTKATKYFLGGGTRGRSISSPSYHQLHCHSSARTIGQLGTGIDPTIL
jgi:hypothetical protein